MKPKLQIWHHCGPVVSPFKTATDQYANTDGLRKNMDYRENLEPTQEKIQSFWSQKMCCFQNTEKKEVSHIQMWLSISFNSYLSSHMSNMRSKCVHITMSEVCLCNLLTLCIIWNQVIKYFIKQGQCLPYRGLGW